MKVSPSNTIAPFFPKVITKRLAKPFSFSRASNTVAVPVKIIASSSLQKSKSTLAPTTSSICLEKYFTMLGSEKVKATSTL